MTNTKRLASLVEQESAKQVLRALCQSKQLAPAYIFDGPSGVGKFHAAMSFVQDLLEISAQEQVRVLAGKYPDIRVFHPRDEGHGNLKVETIREEIIPFVQHAPYRAEKTFILFPRAELTFSSAYPASANSLLKTFEEPRSNVHFILLTEKYDSLLSTIRSRAQRIRFHALSENAVDQILQNKHQISLSAFALNMSQGSVKKGLQLSDPTLLEQRLNHALEIQKTIENEDMGAFVSKAEWLTKQASSSELLETLLYVYRTVIRYEDSALSESISSEIGKEISLQTNLFNMEMEKCVEGAKVVLRALNQLSTNLNPQMILENMLLDLSHCMRL